MLCGRLSLSVFQELFLGLLALFKMLREALDYLVKVTKETLWTVRDSFLLRESICKGN